MATPPQTTPPVPGWLRNTAVLVFLAIAILGAVQGRMEILSLGGVFAVGCLGLERLRQLVVGGASAIFGSDPSSGSIEQSGDFTDQPKQLPGESPTRSIERAPVSGAPNDD